MSLPSSPVLQRLHRLDQSSPDFCDQLHKVLYEQEYALHEKIFEQDDLAWLIDYLDEALHHLDPSTPSSRKCLRELRDICGTRVMLPTSYVLSSHLLEVEPVPFTSGGSGDVYKGTLDGSKICVKRVRVYLQDIKKATAKEFCKEAVTWKHLAHPNVLPLLGITIDHYQLISKWVSGGNLPEYIQKHPGADKLRLLCDVAEGLRYLHSRSVIHGDLKGANVLVEDSGHVLIADFGLAKVTKNLNSVRSPSTQGGYTMRWVAPEVWIAGDYSEKADTFSFAMVMIEVFTGAIPFGDRAPWNVMLIMSQGGRPPRPTHSTFTDSLWKLMQRCWDPDPSLRPDFPEVSRILLTPILPTWKQLIIFPLPKDERISLITSIFSDRNEVKIAIDLSGEDAQAFINAIDEALGDLQPEIRTRALHYLSGICGRRGLLPKSLPNPLSCDLVETAQCHGKPVTVWKGRYNDQQVAVKILKDGGSGLERTRKRFYEGVVIWKNLRHPNVLPLLGTATADDQFTAVSKWMTNGNVNEFIKVHPDANLLEILADVAKGLTYMHGLGVIHGNLAGSNILIGDNGRACLAGFSLLTVIPDEITTTSNSNNDATQRIGGIQWSAPEVLRGGAPGKETDIFSFAMMMIEIFSGTTPLGDVQDAMATLSVTQGDRPLRPKHPYVTGVLWKLIRRCWDKCSASRPEASEALQILLNSDPPAWKRLIDPGLSANERLGLIKSIFSDHDELEVFEYLSGDDAQAFVDVIDEVLDNLDSLPQEIRGRCLHSSYEICGSKALLPKSPPIPLSYNKDSAPPHYGGFADVWKGEYGDQAVAAKVLRVYATTDLERMKKRFCKGVVIWKTLRHPNVLPLLGFVGDQLTTVSEWMTNGDINEFMETHPDANRLELLADVTKGLIYMHEQGMVHGNLKGSNILVDNKGRACIAGFSLLRLYPDRSATPPSYISGGTTRWMSPELLNPEGSGESEGRPTPESDCYALGMVIYEVLTEDAPFARYNGFVVIRKVLEGGRPDRPQGPQGEWFPGGVWEMLGRCWQHRPGDRPSLDVVLRCLQEAAPQWTPPPKAETDEEDEGWGNTGTGGGVMAESGGQPHASTKNPIR